MFKAIELAEYIVDRCAREEEPISNLHMQRILYYVQKVFLSAGKVAFHDEIEAWDFGPVVPNVYYRYSGFGVMPIFMTPRDVGVDMLPIEAIVDELRKADRLELIAETQKKGGAWDQVYADGRGRRHEIPLELIRQETTII